MSNPAEFPWSLVRGQGRLWHLTSLASLEAILRKGEISPNVGQFNINSIQLDSCYSRYMRAVSLFDFDSSIDSVVAEQAWGNLHIWGQNFAVLIGVAREALEITKYQPPREVSISVYRLLTSDGAPGQALTFIPYIEAIYCDPVPTSAFTGFLLTDGGGRYSEVPRGPNAFAVLSKRGADWRDDDERSRAERDILGPFHDDT